MATATLICGIKNSIPPLPTINSKTPLLLRRRTEVLAFNPNPKSWISKQLVSILKDKSVQSRNSIGCASTRRNSTPTTTTTGGPVSEPDGNVRRALLFILWAAEGIYIFWLFLLPYAPGDPVWAISSETVNSLIGLSLNFFFILPIMNSVGIRLIDAPVLHPATSLT